MKIYIFLIPSNSCAKDEKIKNHLKKISNIKAFLSYCKWKKVNCPSHKNDWKKFKSNYNSFSLKVLFAGTKKTLKQLKINIKCI